MNVKDQYNMLISIIEEEIHKEGIFDDDVIQDRLCKVSTLDDRTLREIFKFLTGFSTKEYIRERRVMAAYSLLIKDDAAIPKAIDISGYANHSSFLKEFKRRFGMTIKEAIAKKDTGLLKEPLFWEIISEDTNKMDMKIDIAKPVVMEFGIEKGKLERYKHAMNLQARYDFDNIEAEIAFNFAKDNNLTLDRAFKIVSSAVEVYKIDLLDFVACAEDDETVNRLYKEYYDDITGYSAQLNYIIGHTPLNFEAAKRLTLYLQGDNFDVREEPMELLLKIKSSHMTIVGYGEYKHIHGFLDVRGESSWFDEIMAYMKDEECSFEEAYRSIKEEKEFIEVCMNDDGQDIYDMLPELSEIEKYELKHHRIDYWPGIGFLPDDCDESFFKTK